LSIAITFDIEVEHMDVKTAFLHGDTEEEIYMSQQGLTVKEKENLVWILKKSLYSLNQSPRIWGTRSLLLTFWDLVFHEAS